MNIGGLQKNSLIDFPGRIAAVIFTQGCNFSCPYCHNASLVKQQETSLNELEVLDFLERRYPLLDGVVISGGEPTLQEDLIHFCQAVQDIGYEIKIDSNGSRPEILKDLLDSKVLSYIAMDLKANPEQYPTEITANPSSSEKLLQSMQLIAYSGIKYEFRTTCAAPFIGEEDIEAIAKSIAKHASNDAPFCLQRPYLDSVLQQDFFQNIKPPTPDEMKDLQQIALKYLTNCTIR